MSGGCVAIELPSEVFELARRMAARDGLDVVALLTELVTRHAEYVDTLSDVESPRWQPSPDRYELQRDPGEGGEDFEERLSLFR
ncbi:hypothetical protein [Salinarimonas chemoclinalis]|uniref:hypothetical protein n=1 Tax=Salinarimonas chemoclinalis TaxID=3241599 RepID=UPI003556116C